MGESLQLPDALGRHHRIGQAKPVGQHEVVPVLTQLPLLWPHQPAMWHSSSKLLVRSLNLMLSLPTRTAGSHKMCCSLRNAVRGEHCAQQVQHGACRERALPSR